MGFAVPVLRARIGGITMIEGASSSGGGSGRKMLEKKKLGLS